MTNRDFAYWLQGFFEISNTTELNGKQTEMIKKHLNMVFLHEIDPSYGDQKHQQALNFLHNPFPKNEQEAIAMFGAKPSPEHEYSIHGWYNPAEGVPRC